MGLLYGVGNKRLRPRGRCYGRMEEYQDLLTIVRRARPFVWHFMQNQKNPQERIDCLKPLVSLFLSVNDELQAVDTLGWVNHAIDDLYKLPLCEERREGERTIRILPWSKELEIAQLAAEKDKVGLAMEFYNSLLTKLTPSGQMVMKPGLARFKRSLTEVIILYWADWKTPDEEADKVISFIFSLPHQNDDGEEIAKTIREKGQNINYERRARMIRALLLVPIRHEFGISKIANELAIGMIKTSLLNFELFHRELEIAQLLHGTSAGAIEYVKRETEQIAAFDAKLREMMKILQPSSMTGYHPKAVPGKITWSFVSVREVSILIKIQTSLNCYSTKNTIEREGNDHFENARDQIKAWTQSLVGQMCRIDLELRLVGQYDSDKKEPLFCRNQDHICPR